MKSIRYVIAAVAGSLALAGGTAAAATATPTATTTAPTAPAAAKASAVKASAGKPAAPVLTHLTVYSVNTDNPVFASVISGPVLGDSGSATEVAPGGTAPAKHAGQLLVKLAHGAFRLDIADIGARFTKALGTPVPGSATATIPGTCSDYVSVSGAVPIVTGSGTGAYRGIAGTFAATLTVNELHSTPCEPGSLLYRQLIWLNGAGKITRR